MRPQNTAIRRTSSSAVTSTVRTRRPVRTSQPHQRPVPAPATISCVQTRLRKYLVNSGLDESMPAVQAYREMYNQCTAATDRKSTRLNSSHLVISYAVFCLKKKKKKEHINQVAN